MPSLEREANRLRSLVDDADAIIGGIGSGMSSAAGFNHYRLLPLSGYMARFCVVSRASDLRLSSLLALGKRVVTV